MAHQRSPVRIRYSVWKLALPKTLCWELQLCTGYPSARAVLLDGLLAVAFGMQTSHHGFRVSLTTVVGEGDKYFTPERHENASAPRNREALKFGTKNRAWQLEDMSLAL
ncbi:GTPase [Anopheles sinensis]|uniref:GTPase n=1 Tax=Anopheles sinensis TaxID=74873 RepID=A0A084VG52_ANOSI|nr:GTPase [Anopheles sinensis]